jgi:hypothetical protein
MDNFILAVHVTEKLLPKQSKYQSYGKKLY